MIDSLEDISNETVDLPKPDIEQGKDRFSGVLAAATALFFIGDAYYMYHTQKYSGGARSLFQEFNITQETNYVPQLILDIYYSALFGAQFFIYCEPHTFIYKLFLHLRKR